MMYHQGEYEIYCHQHKTNQCKLLIWAEMMLPQKKMHHQKPSEFWYTANMPKHCYSILACRPVDKENNTTGSAQWKKE